MLVVIGNAYGAHIRGIECPGGVGCNITRHGKPAGVLIGFATDDDWFEYRLENDPRFLKRIAAARESLRSGRGVRLEDVEA